MHPALYVLLCLALPLVWGVVSARLFDLWEASRRRCNASQGQSAEEPATDMYYI